jgi:hypothetical protein
LFFQFLLIAGFFKILSIRAYELDVEEVKQQLDRVESALAQVTRLASDSGNGHAAAPPQRKSGELVGV